MSLTKATYSMIEGAPVNVLDYGAVADGSTDCTANVQAAMDSLSGTGGYVLIPKNVVYDQDLLTFVDFVTLIDEGWSDGISWNLNEGNPGGAVNEFRLVSGYHPGFVLDAHNDWALGTLGAGQAYSGRSSIVHRVNGANVWQIGNDTRGNGTNDWTVYRYAPSSFQSLTFTTDGKAIYGQMASGNDFTADYAHNFRGATYSFENSTGNISLILRKKDNSVRKIIKLDTTVDALSINNTADTNVIFRLKDSGIGYFKTGVSGGAYTTTARNAISVASEDIGMMVFDTTLGKPVWLKNNTGPVWVDATGATV